MRLHHSSLILLHLRYERLNRPRQLRTKSRFRIIIISIVTIITITTVVRTIDLPLHLW